MGTWGFGSFQNDAALDWVLDLAYSGSMRPVVEALEGALAPGAEWR